MNTHDSAPAPACARFAALLPLLDDATFDPTSTAEVHEHLRGCAACRAEAEHYTALDRALRQRFGVAAVVRRHATEEIMQHISDYSPAPSPAPRSPRRGPLAARSVLSGVAGVASIGVVLALSLMLFGSRFGFGFGAHGGPPKYTFAGTTGLFADVSMVSPDEGWALGQVTKTAAGSRSLDDVTFYHFQNGVWTPIVVTTDANFATGGISGFNGTLSMDSATDGWAVAHNFNQVGALLHYTGGTWSQVAGAPDLWTVQAFSPKSVWAISGSQFNTAGIVHYDGTIWIPQQVGGLPAGKVARIANLRMLSDRDGWALVNIVAASNDQYSDQYGLAHYSNGVWTLKTTFSGGQEADFSSFAMVSDTEGWALGQKTVSQNGITAGVPLAQLLYHYQNGHWSQVPVSVSGSGYITLASITMRSPSDGWIIGAQTNVRPGTTASNYQQQTIMLHYSQRHWNQVTLPDTGTAVNAITGLAFTADGHGWACGYVSNLSPSDTVQDTDILAQASPLLWSYASGKWSMYQQ
ncbi:MAG: anti-sigma factor family protein [Ktedonobacterales bacterium]